MLSFVLDAVRAEAFNEKRTLFLFGSYTIGKEKLFLEVARTLKQKVSHQSAHQSNVIRAPALCFLAHSIPYPTPPSPPRRPGTYLRSDSLPPGAAKLCLHCTYQPTNFETKLEPIKHHGFRSILHIS